MIGYVTIGALDVEQSLPFWDAVFAPIGGERGFFSNGWAGYGPAGEAQDVFICPPFDGQPARGGNGVMVGFLAPSVEAVKAAHAAGLAAGGTDEGGPGLRPEDSKDFYGAYLRDPTGNKICIFARGPF
ncbi:MAG: VOC family protein [Caulobacter sp.]|nr:VOC family protein [Caulobacter sp.]